MSAWFIAARALLALGAAFTLYRSEQWPLAGTYLAFAAADACLLWSTL